MKKLILSTAILFALSASVGVMAQDSKAPAKEKKECCKKTADKKDSCCKKSDKKEGCCKKDKEAKK